MWCDLVLVLTQYWERLCSTHAVLGCVSMFLWSCASVDTALRDCVIGTSCLSAPPNKTPPIQFTFHFIASPLCNQMASANAFTPIAETEKRMLLGQRCLSLPSCQVIKLYKLHYNYHPTHPFSRPATQDLCKLFREEQQLVIWCQGKTHFCHFSSFGAFYQ